VPCGRTPGASRTLESLGLVPAPPLGHAEGRGTREATGSTSQLETHSDSLASAVHARHSPATRVPEHTRGYGRGGRVRRRVGKLAWVLVAVGLRSTAAAAQTERESSCRTTSGAQRGTAARAWAWGGCSREQWEADGVWTATFFSQRWRRRRGVRRYWRYTARCARIAIRTAGLCVHLSLLFFPSPILT
jgi:hypothetical protein